jgi:hypothetical protein
VTDAEAAAVADSTAATIRGVFPDLTLDWWERAAFELGWRQHGGSGLGRTLTELLQMPIDQIQRDLVRQSERRAAEAEAIRSARGS